MNLYFGGIVSLGKRINDFRGLQELHKSQTPLLVLSGGKMTDKERKKEKGTLLETLSRRRKKDREWLFVKRKEKKYFFRDLVSKKKKRKKRKKDIFKDLVSKEKKKIYTCEPLFNRREEVVTSFPVLWVYQLVKDFFIIRIFFCIYELLVIFALGHICN